MADRLRDATSEYLRTATDSPIDWFPWGPEAFQRAKDEDKPILLDIGAVWCHWCHVMDHGTYEDDRVVARLAKDFVCVKVDRDERPDVDTRYQRAVGAITGQGGWPLTAFLTPDGQVFYGGTYFPPDDAHGRPGFASVLQQIAHTYHNDRDKVMHSAQHITEVLAGRAHASKGDKTEPEVTPLDATLLDHIAHVLQHEHDKDNGGWGQAPKFPHPTAITLALTLGATRADDTPTEIATFTLDKMAAGGIHDQVAGGFHRYSVDAHWTVPHFEKMAYDNAELLRAYARSHAATGNEEHARVAHGIIDWTLDLMADRERGGFHASQDADLGPHDDGDHFTWTLDELRNALVTDSGDAHMFDIARLRFGVEDQGDMHHDRARNVLEIAKPIDEIAHELGLEGDAVREAEQRILTRLRTVRAERDAPFVDPTHYTDWNAMYASAFLEAGAILDRRDATEHAINTIGRLMAEAWHDDTGWDHAPRQGDSPAANGLLDDQIWMGTALLDAVRFAGRRELLPRAVATARHLIKHHALDDGSLADTATWVRENAIAAPLKEPDAPFLDQSVPGSNPVAAKFLMRLGRLTHTEDLVDVAKGILQAHGAQAPRMGIFAATWFEAVEELLADPPLVTVLGAADDEATATLLRTARTVARPGTLALHVSPTEPEHAPAFLASVVGNEDLVKDGSVALICHGDRCDALESDPNALERRILGIPPDEPMA